MDKEARYWHEEDGRIRCDLCPHNCLIADGSAGLCGVRKNSGGRLITTIYGEVTGYGLDPIEKKPLYHFHPGEMILSLGTKGCNFACDFCQNWTISQDPGARSQTISPGEVVSIAKREGSFAIAYTYSEPMIWFEYMLETAILAREAGLDNILVTNGFIEQEPFEELLPHIGAMNVDLKSMDDEFYRKHCRGRLAPVLETIKRAASSCHIEITNLIIPTLNDTDDHFARLRDWIAGEVGTDTALHLSAYHPMYKMNIRATPVETLKRAFSICREKLKFVYIGNVLLPDGRDTVCPACGNVLIRRHGYSISVVGVDAGKCASCGARAPFVI